MFKHSLLFMALFAPCSIYAADNDQPTADNVAAPTELSEINVTADTTSSDLFDQTPASASLDGQALFSNKSNTLGETLSSLPGMTSTYYGPNASRPVSRGMDGDRMRVLQNGSSTQDASALSFDHAVAIDPMMLDRVEVVRGPAALLYGGNPVAGVVNASDGRIPQATLDGTHGAVELSVGGAANERGGGAKLDAGNGNFVMHVDGYARDTDDLRIPGAAVSDRLRALSNAGQSTVQQASLDANGRLPNSASSASGGAIGGTAFFGKGSLGLSYSTLDSKYGTVAEPDVKIDMNSSRWDMAGELHDLDGWLSGAKFKYGHTDYEHRELDSGVTSTQFNNNGYDSRLEVTHRPLGLLTGTFGVQLGQFDFSALGEEAFVPSTRTNSKAAFLYEDLPLGKQFKLSFSGRVERTTVRSGGGGPIPFGETDPRFGAAQQRDFTGTSASIGGNYDFTPDVGLTIDLASTERAPTFFELFANGPHAATGVYEIGNPDFDLERSHSIDATLHLGSGNNTGSLGAYYNRFQNYITEFNTGNTRGEDGELNPPGTTVSLNTGDDILPEVQFRQVPAVFQGIEAQGTFRLYDGKGALDMELRGDYTRAWNVDTGEPLPRIAPLRIGGGLIYTLNEVNARLDVTRVSAQNRVAADELPTDGYTMVNATANYSLKSGLGNWEAFLRANNLLNVDARDHASFLKDIAPLPGRGVTVGLRLKW